ncbi:hypothetical protein HNQ09_000052 [Deinococcus budaensis]|uniref:Uncharacterized protein n=1 Tax=Deinococcus budaensis TaxID=1665626 RepID=A0A7W8GBU6_9DEIO|nr:hypothetical protein [Deinococcus budaensis]
MLVVMQAASGTLQRAPFRWPGLGAIRAGPVRLGPGPGNGKKRWWVADPLRGLGHPEHPRASLMPEPGGHGERPWADQLAGELGASRGYVGSRP